MIHIFENSYSYLIPWDQFRGYKFYPEAFKREAFTWMCTCLRLNTLLIEKIGKRIPKDIQILIVKELALLWKERKFVYAKDKEETKRKVRWDMF